MQLAYWLPMREIVGSNPGVGFLDFFFLLAASYRSLDSVLLLQTASRSSGRLIT